MSEYQYIAFRAIDTPVSEENMEYMQRQSSRAEITRWSFTNTYQYGDFRGNAVEMLQRGYDIHLHHANFGIRKLMLRLPFGLPNETAVKPYVASKANLYQRDKQGTGGMLTIQPYYESGTFEDYEDFEEVLSRLIPLRQEIMQGDVRPLYLAHFIESSDEEHDPENTKEAPIPAGMAQLTSAQQVLAEFYGLDDALLAAIAEASPAMPPGYPQETNSTAWLKTIPESQKDEWLANLMSEHFMVTREKILTEFQQAQTPANWPVGTQVRTIAEIQSRAEEIRQQKKLAAAAKRAREQAARLAEMAKAPAVFIREVDRLVAERSSHEYAKAARLLAELRTALAETKQAQLAEEYA